MWVFIYILAFIVALVSGTAILQWLCSKGYVAAGINYTLRNEKNPTVSVYSQSMEIKERIPQVIEVVKKLGYPIVKRAIGSGSAGHALAMLYAYRDASTELQFL